MTPYIQVEWMSAHAEEAVTVVEILLQERLVACANIIQGVESHYVWKGKYERSMEVKVLLKSHQKHFFKIQQVIAQHGSYEVPAILAFPILEGATNYLEWLEAALLLESES